MPGRSAMILTLLLALLPAAARAGDAVNVEIWLKRPVNGSQANAKGNLLSLDLKGLAVDELTTYDIQYERQIKVRGLHLRNLLSLYKPIPDVVDMALLHTKNGMIVPVSLLKLRKDIEVFIALEIWQDGKWTSAFPSSVHIQGADSPTVPTTFAGNKLVVGKEWRATDAGFTPWRHLDSLTGIELVESAAYDDQFRNAASATSELHGRLAYVIHCQYCHGVNGVGAQRGPSLTNVVEATGKDAWEKIYHQVHAPGAGNGYQHFMPKQSDFTKDEAKDLVRWLNSLRGGSLAPYAPAYKDSVHWTN